MNSLVAQFASGACPTFRRIPKDEMTRKTAARISTVALAAILLLGSAATAHAQAAARFLGSITAINGATLTVKTDAGESHDVAAPDSIPVKRVEPGQTSLASATAITFGDLAVGARVLVLLDASAATPTARQIIAIKAADVAQKQQKDQEDWMRRGIAGIVLFDLDARRHGRAEVVHEREATPCRLFDGRGCRCREVERRVWLRARPRVDVDG